MLRSNDVGALRTRAIALTSQLSGATAVEQAFDAAFPRPASGETPLTAALSYTLCSRSVVSHSRGQDTIQQVRDAFLKIKRLEEDGQAKEGMTEDIHVLFLAAHKVFLKSCAPSTAL